MKTRRSFSQKGVALVVALVILLLVTSLGVAMFRSFGLQERIAGNTREKEHAFEAAQAALQYGEWWLGQNNAGTGGVCSGALTALQVCSNAVAASVLTTAPWNIGTAYAPVAVNGTSPLVVAPGGGNGTYYAAPRLYINYLGLGPTGQARVYQVTAIGNGGDANSVAVVQSTYAVSTGIRDLGGL